MATILEKSVSRDPDGTYVFQCPGVEGDPCHGANGVPFRSSEHPRKGDALARGEQHFQEHLTHKPMPSLEAFREERGLGVTDKGKAYVLTREELAEKVAK